MKILFENWRKFLTEGNYAGPPLNYSSVVLDGDHALAVLKAAEQLRAEGKVPPEFVKSPEGRWPHHMTINMGPLLPGWENDMPIKLTVDQWGIVNEEGAKAMAFRVNPDSFDNLPIKNEHPHITALVPPDGKPFHSNKIINWEPLEKSFDVTGIVVERAAKQKKKEKPKQQKPKGQDNPVEFAKVLATRGLPPEQIKNIIMNKFNKPEQAALGIMRGAGIQQ